MQKHYSTRRVVEHYLILRRFINCFSSKPQSRLKICGKQIRLEWLLSISFDLQKKTALMRKLYSVFPILFLCVISGIIYFNLPKTDLHPNRVAFTVAESEEEFERQQLGEEDEEEKKDGYDGPAARDQQEFDWMVDPSLGYVPYTRLNSALAYTHYLLDSIKNSPARTQGIMLWQERGPIYDSVGPSNGNTRGNDLYTSGRMAAVLIDTLTIQAETLHLLAVYQVEFGSVQIFFHHFQTGKLYLTISIIWPYHLFARIQLIQV
jgi:hypothetical protein